jgi:hypothetical protein
MEQNGKGAGKKGMKISAYTWKTKKQGFISLGRMRISEHFSSSSYCI